MADRHTVEHVKLSEEDIPGAKLQVANPAKATVKQLRWWLQCRGGALVSGKKLSW